MLSDLLRMEAYEKEGLVKCCNAWSRDQKEKVYVQHKIMEEAVLPQASAQLFSCCAKPSRLAEANIWQHLGKEGSNGFFFLCGSKQPEKDPT